MNREREELAGEYVLGSLDEAQRAEVEQRLQHDAELARAVDEWQERLLPLQQRTAPQTPSALLWWRIQRSLDGQAAVSKPARLGLWRGLAGLGLAASLLLAVLLVLRPPVENTRFLVVLVAPDDRAPGWVVQAGRRQQLQLIPLGEASIPGDRSLQFWTKADDWKGPVSLGLVEPGERLEVDLQRLPPLQPNQLFELTLEARGGSTSGRPSGPIQFIGRAVQVL